MVSSIILRKLPRYHREISIMESGCHILVYSPSGRGRQAPGVNFFFNTFSQSINSLAACVFTNK